MKPFQISKKHKYVIIPPNESGIITNAIPHSVKSVHGVLVPHGATETRILNNLGYRVPSPIYYYYDWPNSQGFKPYEAQVETAAFLTYYRHGFVLNEIGTGKTLASLWALDFLIQQKDISSVLIVSPLSTLNRVWADAIWMNFPHRQLKVLHGTKAKRLKLLSEKADFYIINPDGVKIMWEDICKRKDIDHILIDECAEFRNTQTDKWKALDTVVKSGKTIWGMTGTPTPNAPTDAWGQVKLINPAKVPKYFNRFRMETMIKITDFKWVPKQDALEKVHAVMQPAIRYTRDECYDLPDATYVDLEVELSKEQQSAYNEMRQSLITEYANGEISAANEGVKMSKLIQIAGGVVYDSEGKAVILPCSKRIEELKSNITNAGTKVIVFVPFTEMTYMIEKALAKNFATGAGWTTAVVNGSVSSKKRDEIFARFQSSSQDPHVLIAHPKCMSHGLTLTEASTIIWYAPYANSEVYTQANGRISRSPQKNNQVYIHLQGSEIERRVYKKLRDNQSLQGTLLEMFEIN